MFRSWLSAAVFPSMLCAVAMAQVAPSLHQRGSATAASQPAPAADSAVDIRQGFSTLPADASGEYELDSEGSVVQITIEQGRLTGYVTKMEHETALTLFFVRSTVAGSRISFATKTVHGVSYSFAGSIARGDETDAARPGFYRMAGDWTAHRGADAETMRVSLKSTPRVEAASNQ